MIKMLLGAAIVVALVGYGYLTPSDIERAGDTVRGGVNTVLEKGAEFTRKEPTIGERIDGVLN